MLQLPQQQQLLTSSCSSAACFSSSAANSSSNATATTTPGAEFVVATVEHEYIVRFRGFYPAATRKAYIDRALASDDITSSSSKAPRPPAYTILTRDNPMAGRPSDFDVVRWNLTAAAADWSENEAAAAAADWSESEALLAADWLARLRAHPAVRSVTQEKRLTRRVLETADEGDPVQGICEYRTGTAVHSAVDQQLIFHADNCFEK
jgi:hypothetical protein